jgi:hypothetical protein
MSGEDPLSQPRNAQQDALNILDLLKKYNYDFTTELLKLQQLGEELDMKSYFDSMVDKLNLINKRIGISQRALGFYEGNRALRQKGSSRRSRNKTRRR